MSEITENDSNDYFGSLTKWMPAIPLIILIAYYLLEYLFTTKIIVGVALFSLLSYLIIFIIGTSFLSKYIQNREKFFDIAIVIVSLMATSWLYISVPFLIVCAISITASIMLQLVKEINTPSSAEENNEPPPDAPQGGVKDAPPEEPVD